ncbi:hypothetical protein [Mycobacteroides abscessus]|uniref:hypothetical protein n=1 Tax=Mycobacteroides abscessus TaxID=36809 RepID=UPI000C2564A4|nr:hypothetical protein [Mycobacteroides abscessus]AWG55036.1 hypothetical protein DDT53_12885 [Mycobacteroides abscessus]MDQ8119621.1 hypothetical protein [Mycobacteroides abscessus subsp. massiliense]
MEPIPTAKNPKIPTSQQEAQDTVLRYLQDTLNALPKGSTLDGTRYSLGRVIECDDNDTRPNAPVHFEDWRDIKLPAGTDFNAIINQVGELWKAWGWQVLERDGFNKPNRFGYAPDGYSLDIQASGQSDYAPSMSGGSPCFSGALQDKNSLDGPAVITQTTG